MPVNTAALKTFAPAMRRQLLEAVGRKLDLLLNTQTPDTLSTYTKQIAELRKQEAENREQLLERVAYTWFNRLCALRYLDAKGWHPFGCKVLTPGGEGETQPELLKLFLAGNLPAGLQAHVDESRLYGVLDGQIQTAIVGADPQGEVYRDLVLTTCRFYHELLPNIFEELDDATELLFPDDILAEGSIAGAFRSEISNKDCQDVEIIGWLYQFYISEKKDEVMARKKAVPTEDIPAVTQLFTPHWIVRYLVENSLGRLWLLNRPASKLREDMPYYIEGDTETDFLVINKPEDIKLLDPACGSGHMLTCAFDLLVSIYEEEGYSPNEIPGLILKHNLHGLEICPRAAQLAEMALVFKAREQSRRYFHQEKLVLPRIIQLQDVQFEDSELNDYIEALDLSELFSSDLFKLLHQFEEAKTFGSLIQPCLEERSIANVLRAIEAKELSGQFFLHETHVKVLSVLKRAEALTQLYHIVVANPPYMGSGPMNAKVKAFAQEFYADSKADLFSMFIDRNSRLSAPRGFLAMVTMQTWMFLASFERFRERVISNTPPISLIQIGYNSFPEMNSKVAQACAFILYNSSANVTGHYLNLNDAPQSSDKNIVFFNKLEKRDGYIVAAPEFHKIPGSPIAYWLSDAARAAFASNNTVRDLCVARKGLVTLADERFIRKWHEVNRASLCLGAKSRREARDSKCTWFPINKGGKFRKWYGLNENVINWKDDGKDLKAYIVERYNGGSYTKEIRSEEYYFGECITWGDVTTGATSFRYTPSGFLFSSVGPSVFFEKRDHMWDVLALANSNFVEAVTKALNPTIHFTTGDFDRIPFAGTNGLALQIAMRCVQLSKADWDDLEVSWDFHDQPLLRPGVRAPELEESWRNWAAKSTDTIRRMQELEEENNRLFITAYGMEGELQPEVPEAQITLARADQRKDVAAFLSYATGCMMGRYSLDLPALILANAGDTLENYYAKVGKSGDALTFKPDPDGIIPVLDGEWFEDDIVARTREFLAVTFPESSVYENLRFIEESLGKDIRKYFCSEFYKDHLQTYKKRPIYWMVQSPKKGFACLIYLHRYTKDTLNQVLNNYFRPYLQKLEARLAQLEQDQINDDLKPRERTAARKEAEKITKVLKECQAWEQDALLPLAQQRIELDLDDGVKVNYLKLQDVLATIPGLAAKGD